MSKSKKIKSIELVNKFISVFKCPICSFSMEIKDFKSIVCLNGHAYDFAKQGYINFMMQHSSKGSYDKKMFEARRNIIVRSGIFTPLHDAIIGILKEEHNVDEAPLNVLDAGCGEGSNLSEVIYRCGQKAVTGFGLDISKEAIKLASAQYEEKVWLVGDLSNFPFKEQTFDVILNILAPSNYKEFNRLLREKGMLVKVVPGSEHLKELRHFLYGEKRKKVYKEDEEAAVLFQKNFREMKSHKVKYVKKLEQSEIHHLIEMTPLSWSADKEKTEKFAGKQCVNITVELDILIGKKAST